MSEAAPFPPTLNGDGDRCQECGRIPVLEQGDFPLLEYEDGKFCFDCCEVASVGKGIVTADVFAAVEEPGAEPLVGVRGEVLIPEGGDTIVYGDGGASKTTLSLDLACHLAAGDDWLEFPVPRPLRVLLIEAEGPRAMFREKVRRKLAGWHGSPIGDRLLVLEDPWAEFRFPDGLPNIATLARFIGEQEIDVLVIGPLTAVGFEERGTIQEVRGFMDHVGDFRQRTGRGLSTLQVHHENKGGTISGAFEGACDTLLHAEVHARGKTILTIDKARWSSRWHKAKLELAWIEGEGFEVIEEEERDLGAEIAKHLAANPWRTPREIAVSPDRGGIGANRQAIEEILDANRDLFEKRTGQDAKEVDRHPNAIVWNLVKGGSGGLSHTSHMAPSGAAQGGGGSVASTVGRATSSEPHQMPAADVAQPSEPPPLATPEEEAKAAALNVELDDDVGWPDERADPVVARTLEFVNSTDTDGEEAPKEDV